MRRIVSLFIIAALLSVTSLPLLPQASLCHAAESITDLSTSHSKKTSTHSMHHDSSEQLKAHHKQQKRLSEAEKECRIECGCGCNRSVDGFPQVLSPHLTSTIYVKNSEKAVRVKEHTFSTLTSLSIKVPLPPPELS
ncbi:MAG: hypothetical protein R8K54_00210 [Mariprofundaceae bacterium]